MSTDTFPYRFAAVSGMYAGTTFVYLDGDRVIDYRTDSPDCYYETGPQVAGQVLRPSVRRDMTPEDLAWFNSSAQRSARL